MQYVMIFEDFISNRTTGMPSSIFKILGNTARMYSSTIDHTTVRTSNISLLLDNDYFETVHGITLTQIQSMCTDGNFNKSKRFEVVKSKLISTKVSCANNTIDGEFRGSRIHDELISWTDQNLNTSTCHFNTHTLKAACTCKYFLKVTVKKLPDMKRYCTHIIGQLRRVLFMNFLTLFFLFKISLVCTP